VAVGRRAQHSRGSPGCRRPRALSTMTEQSAAPGHLLHHDTGHDVGAAARRRADQQAELPGRERTAPGWRPAAGRRPRRTGSTIAGTSNRSSPLSPFRPHHALSGRARSNSSQRSGSAGRRAVLSPAKENGRGDPHHRVMARGVTSSTANALKFGARVFLRVARPCGVRDGLFLSGVQLTAAAAGRLDGRRLGRLPGRRRLSSQMANRRHNEGGAKCEVNSHLFPKAANRMRATADTPRETP